MQLATVDCVSGYLCFFMLAVLCVFVWLCLCVCMWYSTEGRDALTHRNEQEDMQINKGTENVLYVYVCTACLYFFICDHCCLSFGAQC